MPEDATNTVPGTDQELADSQSALKALGRVEVLGVGQSGVPTFIRGNFGHVTLSPTAAGLRTKAATAARANEALAPALKKIAPVFGLSSAELNVRSARKDNIGFLHVRYDQVHKGLPVVGGELIVHINAAGDVYAVNGTARGAAEPAMASRVTPEAMMRSAVGGISTLSVKGAPRPVYFLGEKGALAQAYEVTVEGLREGAPARDLVYVDASTGAQLAVLPQIHSALNRSLYSANNQWVTPGTLRRSEGGAATGDAHIDQNYNHIGTTYACYDTLFGRDSYDDAGHQIVSTVHYGSNYVNAYWDGISQIVFGDGDGVNSGQLGQDLDVTSHEFTHAVTQYESGLQYRNESGALNESLSDVAAAYCEAWARGTVDADVWKIGEDIWTPGTAGDALRYMDSPTRDGSSKDYYPERYTGTSDNGGVHWNSGIQNLAFKLAVTGGTHPRGKTAVNVAGIGMNRAAQTWYFAATNYYTSTTTMSQAKAFTVQAAQDRYDAATVDSVRNAWSAVGVP